ncbi:Cadherin domain protein (plasmid) [Paracoccaceae bacterium]|nr:Cadherin domain protein [Paracoccaceae bacterium]
MNEITEENARTDGVMPQSYWNVDHSTEIEGFTTDFSVDAGTQVDFKINVSDMAGSDYKVEIFRLGYYDGNGARMVTSWVNTNATVQPDATFNAATGTVDAGNWAVTDSWLIPEDAVSGVYLARVQRLDANGDPIEGEYNQIPFVVRDDDREADIVLQTSDTTWQAYNGWAGNNGQIGPNFYGDAGDYVDNGDIPGSSGLGEDRAYAVSYNRPFITRGIDGQQGGTAAGAQDYLFGADYAAISWLEQNGYDVSYISGVDTDRLGADYLMKYQAFISVGHDEYWSADQRWNVQEARDAGVNLLFWSGNEMYWKTRWETSVVDGQEYRTLVCYKETWAVSDPSAGPDDYYNLDPTDIWTGTWRDDRFLGNPLAGDAGDRPPISGLIDLCNCAENALTGQLFGPDGTGEFGGALDVTEVNAVLRYWRDTSVAGVGATDMAPGILGYEWDTSPDDAYRPAGLIYLSDTTIPWSSILVDQGNTVAPGTATHNLSLYRAESGALVFGAGTVFWSWALSDDHDNEPYGANIENTAIQQFTINMFADMGIQPGTTDAELLLQGLVRAMASTDFTAATATIDDLPDTLPAGTPILLTGTATDDDGNAATDDGVVALVELSFDGGTTWKVAQGTTTWSYSWAPSAVQTYEILVRAIDDSLNMPTIATLDSEEVEATPPDSVTLFDPWVTVQGQVYDDSSALQLGTRFIPAASGQVTELHYYRAASDADDTDQRIGRLWAGDGTLLATVQFTSLPGESGWQTVVLNNPIPVAAGQSYTVAYETGDNYLATVGQFGNGYTDPFGYLTVPALTGGVFAVGTGNIMPTDSYQGTGYWVDVTFEPTGGENAPPVFTSDPNFATAENTTLAGTVSAADLDTLGYSITGGADAALFSIDAATGALSFIFAPDYEAPSDANGDNVYELTLGVSDGVNPTVTQSATVTVTDDPNEPGSGISTLFGPAAQPEATETADTSDYELGTRFTATASGEVEILRYWRGAADAADTDMRTLNLWSATGALLGSVTVTSAPGQSGWQIGTLTAPVQITAGQTYTVSYGTTQNYAISLNYFDTPHSGPDGTLSSPTSAGVYATAGPGAFPTFSYANSNYWVDVGFVAGDIANQAPVFTLAGTAYTLPEMQGTVTTLTAFDADTDTLIFAIAGGDDADAFQIGPDTGVLSFADLPDFELPGDLDGDNVYDLVVSVSDGTNPAVQQAITISVTDVEPETGSGVFTLFGSGDTPAQTVTSDPTDYELGVRFSAAADGEVTALRYWRGTEDATDTDTRTLNLWSATGTLLASAQVVSTAGQVGWQTATLAAPVQLDVDTVYVASYGTTQNYAFSGNFFASGWTGPDDMLAATGSGGNGVFYDGGTGLFPTLSYNASNYWVDVIFDPYDTLL